ncbi:MAG: FAD-dependent oxidoreductase [Bryobacteraceae bacterium]
MRVYPPLETDIKCDALVIGGGISGALLAKQLLKRGVDCVLIDRRDIGFGSTSASTALLQYEIDTPLHVLRGKVGGKAADQAYRLGVDSIRRLQNLAGKECGFALRPSIQIADRVGDLTGLSKECAVRRELGFQVKMIDQSDLRESGIHAVGALRSAIAGEVDPYRLTHRLLRLASAGGLRVFDRTAALSYRHSRTSVTVATDRGPKIKCRAIFFATGYETRDILPEKIVKFRSTYALISEPVDTLDWWKDRAVIWGTGDPYSYMRTTSDNRILVGGEDDDVLNPKRRDAQIPAKVAKLVGHFQKLFPQASIEPAFGWAGLFGSTKDGLAYIGPHPAFPRAFFALGYGGNGITFSEIASRMLTDLFLQKRNPNAAIFAFNR